MTTSTVMDIQYRTVLTNLAMMSVHPEALPSHADLADGVVQINDRLGFGQSGGFTTFSGQAPVYGFGLDQFGPFGQRQVTEQWGADATTDPQRLTDLQDLYRLALGLAPLPPPNSIDYLRRIERKGGKGRKPRESPSRDEIDEPQGREHEHRGMNAVRSRHESNRNSRGNAVTAHQRSVDTSGVAVDASAVPPGEELRVVPIEVLLSDVPPPGWFHIGRKRDVPRHACYVGRYCDHYCWVMPDGIEDLSRFTITVLNVVKLKPGEQRAKSGLTFTNQ